MNRFTIPIVPMGAVRMTHKGKFKDKNAQKYLTYKSAIQWQLKQQLKGHQLIIGPVHVDIWFNMPIPASWSCKKKAAAVGTRHCKKPDIDNLTKGLFDSLNQLIWADDNQVASMTVYKVYAKTPGIDVLVKEVAS
ncbi:RusA family crossover junction endodeoxyribonuclease [Bacillus gobiensis]|uniref:RusA family crossover junction endodeoxyribonuclease n=1 Tax=Bacillus gobiensis TaxID=1441095 RepID=UPI003D1F6543